MSEILENILNKPAADLLIIGCSTGGPSALQSILPRFPKDTHVPIVVLQHMPPGFTKPLAERFDAICNLQLKTVIFLRPAIFKPSLIKKQIM